MVDITSIPSELLTGILQTMLGQGYVNSIAIGILILLTGYMFLSYRFVVRGSKKDKKEWDEIKQADKLVISFFIGLAFLFLGVETLFIFILISKITNIFQPFFSLGISIEMGLYLLIFFYAYILIYPKNFNKKITLSKQIENYFKSIIKIFCILISLMFLLTITLAGVVGFFLFIWFYLNTFEKKRFNSFLKKIKTRINH